MVIDNRTDCLRIMILAICLLAMLACSCTSKHAAKRPANRIIDLAGKIPENASVTELKSFAGKFFDELDKLDRRNIGLLRESIVLIRKQPNIVKALSNYYAALSGNEYGRREMVISVIGELQRKDSFDFLKGLVWANLPDSPPVSDGLSQRDHEVILQMKAVEGLGFIREEDGSLFGLSQDELLLIMKNHPEKSVKITAIDSYMWNHGDEAEAAKKLYATLPDEYHKFVERPRFTAGANREIFEKRIAEWEEKWGDH